MLKKSYYYSEDHLQIENEKIFSNTWIFACLTEEIKVNSDFVTLEIGGNPIVIQNFKGELRAFQNICTHRFNKIQTQEFGRRALTCGYHCWSFDKEGAPSFMPKKETFSAFKGIQAIPSEFCLKKYQVEVCGHFVFVLLNENQTIDLRSHLGEFYNKLEELSANIGSRTHIADLPHKANWKMLIENVLECYHCSVVHKETIYGKLGIGGLAISDIEHYQAHSSCHFPKTVKKIDAKKNKILAFLEDRAYKHQSFYHLFIFPNLVISSTEGASFYVGQLFPLTATETNLKIRFLEPNISYDSVNPSLRAALADESVRLGIEILQEDRQILENIQKGISHSSSPGIISDEEVRIQYFFDAYNKAIAE
ncbi:aromatic ring-hydroxylating dioxygenase subunit alpha [Pedobacter sp. BG31]|uniref:aromatic ring-hydroxylating oxygenase subunit alpha n=1 Tax=Pedobacter sp. BG31 TaxID=3349697 RepID=UPI0035F3DABB